MTGMQRQQLISFLGTNLTYGWSGWPLVSAAPASASNLSPQWTTLSTAVQVADFASSSPQFKSIGLGGLTGVVEIALLEEAVAQVLPRTNPAFAIVAEGLKIAAERQRGESWATIIRRGGIGVAVAGFLFLLSKADG